MAATFDLTNRPTEHVQSYLRYQSYGSIRPTQTRFIWEIHDFGKTVHKCTSITSPVFTTPNSHPAEWVLTLFPNGCHQEYKDYIAVNIQCLNQSSLVMNVQISLLNGNGAKCDQIQRRVKFNRNSIKCSGWTNHGFVHRSVMFDKRSFYILNDAIQICCVITTDEGMHTEYLKAMEEKNHLEKIKESSKFGNLLNEKIFTDVTLTIGNEKIEVHRAILACSSSVFKAMFTHRMSENDSREVKIEDIDISTVKAMLKFIYSADLENFNSNRYNCYLNLLIAAEKYCIESLKEKCQKVLMKELTLDNVLNCIVHADIHNALHLKRAAIDFAAANATAIVEGPTFEEFMKYNTAISCEVVRVLVTKKRKLIK